MPSLLIYKLSNASLSSSNSLGFILSALLAIFFTMIILMLANKIKPTSASSFTSVVQGGIRFNTYVFLALSGAIFGNEGLVLSAIILTFAIPFISSDYSCTTTFGADGGNSWSLRVAATFRGTSNLQIFIGSRDLAVGAGTTIRYMAIGRWK